MLRRSHLQLASVVILAIGGAASPAPAQAGPPTDPRTGEEIVINETFSVEMILVPVAVQRGDRFVEDLGPENFRLLVDGSEIPIETFEYGTTPLSIVLLQDLSGSMAGRELEISRVGIGRLLEGLEPRDEVAVATFAGGSIRVEVPFTGDRETLRETLAIWEGYGTTGLYDAVAWLPHLSMAGSRTKRAAILSTDGVDNASEIPAEEAREIVRRAKLPVYVLGLETGGPTAPRSETFRYADLLRVLAEESGGRYHAVSSLQEAREATAAILHELRRQYVLGFSVVGSGPETYRPIEVEVRGRARRASLVHREGYRGTRPAAMGRSTPDGSGRR